MESSKNEENSAEGEEKSYNQRLDKFREDWRQELTQTAVPSLSTDDTEKAKDLFYRGSQAESKGFLHEAVRFYRQAIQLVPDIEFLISSGQEIDGAVDKRRTVKNHSNEDTSGEIPDLVARFQKLLIPEGYLCRAEYDQKMAHISLLPMEILLYLFKWVISADLDLRSLEQLSLVCRGFYLCARDPELWRLACQRVWGICTPGNYGSWRNMYLQRRPRLRYDGAYISKTTYVRDGENSFQDHCYRPWHLVEYFRYVRFFPDGIVLMLTTPDHPQTALGNLVNRKPRHSAVLVGRYYLRSRSESVLVILKRSNKPETGGTHQHYLKRHCYRTGDDDGEQTFQIELRVKDLKQKSNYKLVWMQYTIRTVYKNGTENTSEFELTDNMFPPFWFSRVRSYTAESNMPLY
uniref:F-box only protein 9 n=1 Tax=Strigamia maritima TaxID=126957 RepID=T1IV17_STRMM